MKKYLIGLTLIALLAAIAVWRFNRETTLAGLQKEYLLAKTKPDSAKVIDRLEKYYLNLPIPDALKKQVERDVALQVDTTKINPTVYQDGTVADTNISHLEGQLQGLLQKAAIAHARHENQTFQDLMSHAKTVAQTVDASKQVDYWAPFVEEVNAFTREKAVTWLKAIRAEYLCWAYQDHTSKIVDAERLGAFSLKLLQQVNDERVRLDVMQRLQFILYEHLSMYELSIALSQKSFEQAEKIKYLPRSIGILYHQAQAFARKAENQIALITYDKVIDHAQKVKGMQFFVIHSLLGQAKAYLELGELWKALNNCKQVEIYELQPRDRIRLWMLEGNTLKTLGNYEEAETVLKQAITLAYTEKDTFNLIDCQNSLGVMFQELEEYDLALDYYDQARSLFTVSVPDLGTRIRIFYNIAITAALRNDFVQFEEIIKETQKIASWVKIPFYEAQSLHSLGSLYKRTKEYNSAIYYLQTSDSIFTAYGFERFALLTRIDLVDCLIGLSRFKEAKTLVSAIASLAKRGNDVEREIDAINSLAKILYEDGDIVGAVKTSNQLVDAIESLSSRFNNVDRLMAFRQKNYNFLKSAVCYEIAYQRLDSAYYKLDNAKAYALKSKLLHNQRNDLKLSASEKFPTKGFFSKNLQERDLVIDYMTTTDTLYAFVLNHAGLHLFSKGMNLEGLKKTVQAYKDSIQRTIQAFQHYNVNRLKSHYAGTAELGQKLYQDLLGWPELQAFLQQAKLLYIIPDEFLYELPFSTLIAKCSDMRTYVANQVGVVELPSARFLQTASATPTDNQLHTKRVLISVDRRFSGANRFVAKVKSLFPLTEELITDSDAFTKEDIIAKLKADYQIYILLGHGSANAEYPAQSYIELAIAAPENTAPKLIQISLSDLRNLKWLNAEMVMLVGCETAIGKLYRGTGISSLLQGFLSLGAKNVVGNLWEIDASQAIPQAQNFLTAWVLNGNLSQALQECQVATIQQLLKSDYYQQPHPYFWGSTIVLTANTQ
ncbi:MAG: hypothetical protein ILNGONEN_00547 [Syntrophorhabdaceae bacterium]|nr:hypothetical protein [Syntrophorhabdaceae bacterium]